MSRRGWVRLRRPALEHKLEHKAGVSPAALKRVEAAGGSSGAAGAAGGSSAAGAAGSSSGSGAGGAAAGSSAAGSAAGAGGSSAAGAAGAAASAGGGGSQAVASHAAGGSSAGGGGGASGSGHGSAGGSAGASKAAGSGSSPNMGGGTSTASSSSGSGAGWPDQTPSSGGAAAASSAPAGTGGAAASTTPAGGGRSRPLPRAGRPRRLPTGGAGASTVPAGAGSGGAVSGAVEGASNAAGGTGVAPAGLAGLLDSPSFTAPPAVRTWLQSGGVDPRVVSMLDSILAHHTIGVSNLEVLSTPVHVQSFDIVSVDGATGRPRQLRRARPRHRDRRHGPQHPPRRNRHPMADPIPRLLHRPQLRQRTALRLRDARHQRHPRPRSRLQRNRHRPTPTPNELRHRRPTHPRRRGVSGRDLPRGDLPGSRPVVGGAAGRATRRFRSGRANQLIGRCRSDEQGAGHGADGGFAARQAVHPRRRPRRLGTELGL